LVGLDSGGAPRGGGREISFGRRGGVLGGAEGRLSARGRGWKKTGRGRARPTPTVEVG